MLKLVKSIRVITREMESVRYLSRSYRMLPLLKTTRVPSVFAQCRRNFSSASSEKPSTATENAQSEGTQTELEKKLSADVQSLTEQAKTLDEQNKELLDKYKRSLADGENMRNRLTKQIQDAKVFGIQAFCKDLLEVADTLGHATRAVPKDEVTDKNPHLKNLYDGLVLTKNSLQQVFKRHGLEAIEPMNTKFDPNEHEALFQKECKDVEPGMVVEVTKIGYKLHNRCIRPALVGVSRN